MRLNWGTAGLLAAAVCVPLVANPYVLFVASQVLINCLLALGLNLVLGFAGQFAFANAAFFAIGAYTAALLKLHLGIGLLLGFPAAILIGAVVAIAIGMPALRLRGLYLAMVTLAFAQMLQWVLVHWPTLTFGAGGVRVPGAEFPLSPFAYETNVYLLCLVAVVVGTAVASNLIRSRVGRAFIAIRDGEAAAQSLGVHVARYKTVAFALSACYAGAAGALHIALLRFIAPESYDLSQMVMQFAMVVVGGLGSVTGSVLGAVVLTGVPELLRAVKGIEEIVFGAVLVLGMILLPEGLYGFLRRFPTYRESVHRVPAPTPTRL